jgi:hypothetical protein
VLLGLDEVSIDRLFAQCIARFEAMQPVYENEPITIAPNWDGCLLSDFQHTLRDLLDGLWVERSAALYWYVDVRDRKFFSPHHGLSPEAGSAPSTGYFAKWHEKRARVAAESGLLSAWLARAAVS